MSEVDLSDLKDLFFEEAAESVSVFEATMLALESKPGNQELLHRVFRAAHSIKGGAATFGYQGVASFTHRVEGLLDRLRSGKAALTPDLAGLLLRALDGVKALLAAARNGAPPPDVAGLLEELAAATPTPPRDVRITFAPSRSMLVSGPDPLLALRDLRELGEVVECVLDTSAIPPLAELDPTACHARWRVRLRTVRTDQEVRDRFAFVEDRAEVSVAPWTAPAHPTREHGSLPAVTEAPAAAASIKAPAQPTCTDALRPGAAGPGTLRVSSEKVDRLIDLVGEIVISQSMLLAAMNASGVSDRVREAALELERNTRELQERVMGIRMVPIGSVFGRFPRMVRDLSMKLGKKVNLVAEGEATEIDKGAVEIIADPLTHLLRNAIDHGIETPEERVRAGKPPDGTVSLRASHQGGHVVIEVADDGRGVDVDRVRAKGLERGLLREDEELEEDKIIDLLFEPGFSTAAVVSDVSGRGVGMDVVKRGIEALGGALQFSTRSGEGSTLRMKLPLTMAILNGLSVRVGREVFVLPIVNVLESFRPKPAQLSRPASSGEVVRVRGTPLPLVRLHDLLGVADPAGDPCDGLVCVVEAGVSRVAFVVDDLLGESQVVVKTIETNYGRVEGVMGATIMGDGQVAFILDPPGLVRRAAGMRAATEGGRGPVLPARGHGLKEVA